jgi:hypothetical protein
MTIVLRGAQQHTDGPRFEGAEVDEKTDRWTELASGDDTALK